METNKSLKDYNSFHFDISAKHFFEVRELEHFRTALSENRLPHPIYVLGGGSNVLFTGNFYGSIIHPVNKQIELVSETDEDVIVNADAGIDWDAFVSWCIQNGYYGLENLSYIPGQVGAAPIQNIGAYGVEVESAIVRVFAMSLKDRNLLEFEHSDCQFSYRDSIFKHQWKNKILIYRVAFRLQKRFSPMIEYGALKERIHSTRNLTPEKLRDMIIKIRREKLPDPEEFGNVGSFFKNPVLDAARMQKLRKLLPDIPAYEAKGRFKIPAAFLIDRAGWKAVRREKVGVHEKQALVLINIDNAHGKDVLSLAEEICSDVERKFGVSLEMEVNVIS